MKFLVIFMILSTRPKHLILDSELLIGKNNNGITDSSLFSLSMFGSQPRKRKNVERFSNSISFVFSTAESELQQKEGEKLKCQKRRQDGFRFLRYITITLFSSFLKLFFCYFCHSISQCWVHMCIPSGVRGRAMDTLCVRSPQRQFLCCKIIKEIVMLGSIPILSLCLPTPS